MRRLLLVLALAVAPDLARAATTVADYLAIDQSLGPTPDALPAWGATAGRARDCPPIGEAAEPHVRCLLAALNEAGADGDGKLSTLLAGRRGDPFSIAAAVLLLQGRPGHLDAVVFGDRVLLGLEWDRTRYFDPASGGGEMTIGLAFATYGLPFSRAERADVDRFLGYYAGRLAVAASSEPLFQLAVKTTPGSGRLRYHYGAWLLRQSRLEESREQLAKATQRDPDHLEAWIDRGTVLARLGRLKPARRCFVQALRVDPASKAAAENLQMLDARMAAVAAAAPEP